ncbi:MAG: sodium-dependent transporter [Dehalococcoidia bacterium]
MSRDTWASNTGFILATVGSAVGVGNIWRFPHLVGQNGGGAFLLAYLLSVLAIAIPLLMLEFATGRHYAASVVHCFARIGQRYRWVGVGIVLMIGGIMSYYLVIVGWGLGFFFRSAIGQPTDFAAFTQGWEALVFFVLALIVVMVVVAGGIKGGIEKANLWLMPVLVLLVVALAIYSLTLEGRAAGLAFYLTPDFNSLSRASTWGDALGQAFFSIGVGTGVMITYGSYLSRNTDLHTSALWVAFADMFIALLAGLMIFPMVFTFGLNPAEGPELAFQTLPIAFGLLPLGALLGALFFLLFALAGFSSAFSMLEAIVAPIIDGWQWSRWRAVGLVGVVVLVVGIPSALSYTQVDLRLNGERFLDLMDENLGTLGIPVAGLVGGLVMAWATSKLTVIQEIDQVARWRVGTLVVYLTRYAVPTGMLVTLVVTVVDRWLG